MGTTTARFADPVRRLRSDPRSARSKERPSALRHLQRLLRADARPDHDLLVRAVRTTTGVSGRRAARQARPDLPAARAHARGRAARDRQRLGQLRHPRRLRLRLPCDDNDDLRRAIRARSQAGGQRRTHAPRHGSARPLPRSHRAIHEACFDRDDRGGRLARPRRLLRNLLATARPARADGAADDRHRGRRLRSHEGAPRLHQTVHLPGGLPPLGHVARQLRCADSELQLLELHDIGRHYPETLRRWRTSFDAQRERVSGARSRRSASNGCGRSTCATAKPDSSRAG